MKFLLAITLLLTSQVVLAAGDAGCGLGSMIISRNSKLLQLFALTTNSSMGTQLLGITSGTSNCTSSGLVMNEKEIQYYAEANQNELTKEMAQGQGQKLATLAALYGCNEGQKAQFASMTQQNFESIVPSHDTSAEQMILNLNEKIKQSQMCGI